MCLQTPPIQIMVDKKAPVDNRGICFVPYSSCLVIATRGSFRSLIIFKELRNLLELFADRYYQSINIGEEHVRGKFLRHNIVSNFTRYYLLHVFIKAISLIQPLILIIYPVSRKSIPFIPILDYNRWRGPSHFRNWRGMR
jgi:hypothetical protein